MRRSLELTQSHLSDIPEPHVRPAFGNKHRTCPCERIVRTVHTTLLWLRRDLRLGDNPTLAYAAARGAVVPVAIEPPAHSPGIASAEWRAASLVALDTSLHSLGSRLVVRSGPAEVSLVALASETGADVVACTRSWDPASLAEERRVAAALSSAGVRLEVRESQYLVAPTDLHTGSKTPYQVFTPYYRAWVTALPTEQTLDVPARLVPPTAWPAGDVALRARAVDAQWRPGENGATERLDRFVRDHLNSYDDLRDDPSVAATSGLSPHLAAGEISPKQIRQAIADVPKTIVAPYLRQLAWREFSAHVLHANPDLDRTPLRARFSSMPWIDDPDGLERWRRGMTGYPLVDAGMRQLAATGWMHNRVRLVAASFLVKDLLISWTQGEEHFSRTLIDADTAQNAFNWQWVAGSGADAAPYFRIFNPSLQGKRFDSKGAYVRRWVPELAALPDRWIHEPWKAPEFERELARSAVDGEAYPAPMIEHAEARERALASYASLPH
jgi:deoxyribodipyrimidine photo-lyase